MDRLALVAIFLAVPGFSADWNPRLTADYMDARQKAWFAWPAARGSGAPCMSCHTGMTYMLVRPQLRQALGEEQPTEYEQGYSRILRSRAGAPAPSEAARMDGFGTDTVLRAFLLAVEDGGKLSAETMQAFDSLWAAQKPDGGWPWYSLNDDPWEMPESRFFGASIAALAAGAAPAEYRAKPEVRDHIEKLTAFLNHDDGQPLHNRMMLLWASAKLPEVLPAARRKAILDQVRQAQQADGGWTMASLGPFQPKPEAPVSSGSNGYATAFTAFALEQAGLTSSDATLSRALAWLRSHQDAGGFWDATSMN